MANTYSSNEIPFRAKLPLRFRLARKAGIGLAAAGCACLLLGAGTTLAYLTDTDAQTNTFTVVESLKIDLQEPKWDAQPDTDKDGIPDAAEELVPTQTITKDPQVKNTAGTEAWVFLEVQVPTYNVRTVSANGGSVDAASNKELFTYAVDPAWVEMGTGTYNSNTNMTTHYYAYKAPVAVNAITTPLFTSVALINLADDQLAFLAKNNLITVDIPIHAYGIQTHGFDTYAAAWDAYGKQHQA
ncbi:MAG: SipW-dependent-type signal peptide-containing protein [Coriobacteriia bacterium]|nr:SipW-dependent-type signal peptide-containing protein [Coriobacteriia bacterium]